MDILFVIGAVDGSNVAHTLYFSQSGFIDADANYYEKRIIGPAQITISPNDGGLLSIFKSASVGDITLANADGGLDYLADYAVDGRSAVISYFDGDAVTERFSGTVSKMSEQDNTVIFSLRALQETLTNNHPMAVYAGDNVLPAGLEGTADTIIGTVKPKVFGDVRNIQPILVNSSLLIYQCSDLANCRITAVYDDGVRLTNFTVSGSHSVADTTVAVHNGLGDIPAGSEVIFSNHSTIYAVDVGIVSGILTLLTGLAVAVPNGTAIDVVNFYTDTSDIQTTNYLVDGDQAKGLKTIAVGSGVGAINSGDKVIFSSHLSVYTVATGLTGGVIVLDRVTVEALSDGDVVQVVGSSPPLWGAFEGYLRLTAQPAGVVTCDAISIDGTGQVHKAGDVFGLVADEAGITVDSVGITEFNSAGIVGLYIDATTPTLDLFNKLAAGVAGYYYFIGATLYLQLLQAPSTPSLTIDDYQIKGISRLALGLGSNGLPIYSVICKYDRIESVQATVAGYVSSARRQRLKTQYREITSTDSAVLTRHILSLALTVESLLRTASSVNALLSRLMGIVKYRRDLVDLSLDMQEYTPVIGDTVRLITPRLGYSSGRNFVVIGYDIDDVNHSITLRLYG